MFGVILVLFLIPQGSLCEQCQYPLKLVSVKCLECFCCWQRESFLFVVTLNPLYYRVAIEVDRSHRSELTMYFIEETGNVTGAAHYILP